ncbi:MULTISPECIES: hypothetical protein [unclassified Bartonella]
MARNKVIVAKQRHGSTGIVPLAFQSDFIRFSDLENRSRKNSLKGALNDF